MIEVDIAELREQYIGGQLEVICDRDDPYQSCGEIKDITLTHISDADEVVVLVDMKWCASWNDDLQCWLADDTTTFALTLCLVDKTWTDLSEIGDCFRCFSEIMDEQLSFYPAGYFSNLDPGKVQGLIVY